MTQYYLLQQLLSLTTVKYDESDAACVWWHIYKCRGGFFNQSIKLRPFGGKRARKRQLYRMEAGAESRPEQTVTHERQPAFTAKSENVLCYWAVCTFWFPINASNVVLHVLVTKQEFLRFQQWLKSQGKQVWMKRTHSRTWAAD